MASDESTAQQSGAQQSGTQQSESPRPGVRSLGPEDVELRTADGRLRILFTWNHDRFMQRILIDDVEVGRSIEGDGDQDWPPSPPIQQISLEPIDGANVVLGVGGAGRGHWSISVQACDDSGSAIQFDLACRTKDPPSKLQSTYQLSEEIVIDGIDGETEFHLDRVSVVPDVSKTHTNGAHRWSYRLRLR